MVWGRRSGQGDGTHSAREAEENFTGPETLANCGGTPPEGESTQDFGAVELPCGIDTLVCPLRSRYNTRGQAGVPVLQKPVNEQIDPLPAFPSNGS